MFITHNNKSETKLKDKPIDDLNLSAATHLSFLGSLELPSRNAFDSELWRLLCCHDAKALQLFLFLKKQQKTNKRRETGFLFFPPFSSSPLLPWAPFPLLPCNDGLNSWRLCVFSLWFRFILGVVVRLGEREDVGGGHWVCAEVQQETETQRQRSYPAWVDEEGGFWSTCMLLQIPLCSVFTGRSEKIKSC